MSAPVRPLRVALLASSRYPIGEPFAGGLEAHVATLARALRRRGHTVRLFAAPGSDPDLATDVLPVDDVDLPTGTRRDVTETPALEAAEDRAYRHVMARLAGELADAVDVVHNHSLHDVPVDLASSLPHPVLATLHTPPFPRLAAAHVRDGGRAVRCIAGSRHVADTWRQAVTDVEVVPPGVDVRAWPVGPGGGPLVWSGRLVPEKGAHLAIDAARACGRTLHLAGPVIDTEYMAAEIAPRLGDDVVLHGHLAHRDLAALVGGGAVALVTPEWDEPYGLVAAEALACGTPVVAFARGGLPEIVTPASGRLVPAGDVAAMAAAVGEAAELPRADARRRAEEHASIDRTVVALEALYRASLDRVPVA